MDLTLIWALVIALGVIMYIVLDGFDLGVGILFPFAPTEDDRDIMMASIAPVWDGNETWLVLGGAALFGAFPLAYSLLLPALYVPLTLFLIGLIFRGVAFEFRAKAQTSKQAWNLSFAGGSALATFAQGVVLGSFIQGFPVADGRPVIEPFGWLTPFSLATGAALMAGYALLGATWLLLKTKGDLQGWCYRAALPLTVAVLAAIVAVSLWTPFAQPDIAARWFAMPQFLVLLPIPAVTAGVGLALQFTPTDALTVYARASYSDDRADQRAIQSLSGFTGAVSRPGPDTDAGRAIATAVEAGVLPPGFGPSNTPSPGDLLFTGVTGLSVDPRTGEDFPGSDSETILATVNIEWDVGAMTLVSLTGYAGQEDVLRYDGDFFGLPDQTFVDGVAEPLELFDAVDFRNDYDQISQELRLQNFDAERVRWAVGGLYWDASMDQDNNSLRALGGFPFDGFTPPVAALSGSTLFANSIPFSVPQGRDIESWSIYGLVEVDVTSRLRVSAELRYIDEEQTVTRSEFTQTLFAPLLAPLPAGTEQATVSDNAFLPRLSVDYGLGDDTIVYASIARGFKPGGVSELNFGTPLADSRFDAETLWNYELGVKSTLLDGQMFLNGAVFYMDWNDLQTTRLQENPDTASGVSNIVLNAGGAEVIGLDLSATVKPAVIDGLVLSVGYTFLDAEYTDFTEPATSPLPITDAGNCTVATVAGATVCNVTLNGNRLERAPRHSLTANIYYERPVTDGLSAFIDVAVQYQSDRFLQSGNNFVLPSYTNVDLSVGVQTDHWTAQFYTTNATGSDTVRTAQENFDLSTFGRSVNLFAPPRTAYGVRVGYRY